MSALRALATLLVGLMIVLVLGMLMLGTPAGSALLVGALADLAGDRLRLTGVRGTLLEGLAVDELKISAGRTTIVIEPAELSMSWPDLLRRRLRLTTARADRVRIDVAPRPADEPDSMVQPLLLPFAIVIDALEISRLVVRNGVNEDAIATAAIVPVEIGPVVLRGELVDGSLRFDTLRAELYGFELDAGGVFGTGEPFALDAQLRWTLPAQGVSGQGALSGDLAALRFEQVVRVPSPVGVGGVARLLQDQPLVVAEARWTDLKRPLGADPGLLLRSSAGRLQVRGWTDRLSGTLDGALRIGSGPTTRLRATAVGDTRQLAVPEIRLDGYGGVIAGSGSLTLREPISGAFRLQGQRIDTGLLDPRFPGQVAFAGEVAFDAVGDFSVKLPEVRGTLFKRPLQAAGVVTRKAGVLAFDDVRITAGANRVELAGSWGDRISGQFQLDAPDLATLWPGYRGSLSGTGQVGGTVAQPSIDLDLTGRNLSTGELRSRSLRARGGIGARQRVGLDLDVDGLMYGRVALGDLAARLSGRLDEHSASVVLAGGDVAVELRATGSYRNGVVTETMRAGNVTVLDDQSWVLEDTAMLRVAGPDIAVLPHCWRSGDAQACLADSRYGPRGFSGGAELRRFPLSNLGPWLPADMRLAGTATASLTVQGDPAALERSLRGSLLASLSDAVITWRVPDDEDIRTEITECRVDAALTDGALAFNATVTESFGLRLTAGGRVTDPLSESPVIAATIVGGVPDLTSLRPVVERLVDVGDVAGKITLDASLSGNARRPDISGGLELEDGAFTVPAAGIKVDRISLSALGREDGQVALKGNARSGKGYVALDGALAWRDQLLPTAEATLKGRVFDVINLKEGLVQVSPDVRVVLRERQFRVSGELLVPRASIKLKKIEESAVQPSVDTVVHGRTLVAVEKSPPLFVLDDVQVRLGEKVSFEGFGLKTGLTGGLRLNQALGADPTLIVGTGVVSLREGQFSAFGQKLAIDRGSLLFSGVVTDPGLDVKASRAVDYEGRSVTVGVLLSGNLSRIQTSVFSEPAMGELDALSYLTTGKPLSAAGAGDRSLVADSAISLGLSQALPVFQQLGSALRVDEVAFDTTKAGGTAVVVGEQLGKNLFIRYSYGIFDKLGTVKATYKLGRRLSIEGSSGEVQALDLIYSINW